MASLSVRKLDNAVYEKLRIRAVKHGVSMEEEARQIISKVVGAPKRITRVFQDHFGESQGIDLEAVHQREPHQPMDFE